MSRPSAVSRDRWLVSYADFMTLLCAFFTTLYASSLVDASKAAAPPAPSVSTATSAPAAAPLAAAPLDVVAMPLALVPVEAAAAVVPERAVPGVPATLDAMQALRDRLAAALAVEVASGRLQLVDDRRGLVVEVPETSAFAAGEAALTPTARDTMRRIGAAVADLPNALRVEGHTDDRPIRTARFASNWELSTARATDVVALFLRESGIAAARLSAAGYGEHRPRADNATAAGRARNRRVDIVILNVATEASEEPAAAEAPR